MQWLADFKEYLQNEGIDASSVIVTSRHYDYTSGEYPRFEFVTDDELLECEAKGITLLIVDNVSYTAVLCCGVNVYNDIYQAYTFWLNELEGYYRDIHYHSK
jgi:hypothetical protein